MFEQLPCERELTYYSVGKRAEESIRPPSSCHYVGAVLRVGEAVALNDGLHRTNTRTLLHDHYVEVVGEPMTSSGTRSM